MLYFVIFSLFFNILSTRACCSHNATCPVSLQEDFIRDSHKSIETMKQNKKFQSFLSQSFEQREAVLKNSEFQDAVENLQKPPLQSSQAKHTPSNLYIFVSFSIGEKALTNLAQQAKAYDAILILRGFKDNSYAKTVNALQRIIQETGQGFLIDPELFNLFGITAVPTYVLSQPFQLSSSERFQTPLHDRLMGHVSVRYALEVFAKEGDLKEIAASLLNQGKS